MKNNFIYIDVSGISTESNTKGELTVIEGTLKMCELNKVQIVFNGKPDSFFASDFTPFFLVS